MGQMSNEEAARILDPETSREALAPYAHDCQLRLAVTEEACTVAAKVLRQTAWVSGGLSCVVSVSGHLWAGFCGVTG